MFYSHKILYFKRILIELKAFLIDIQSIYLKELHFVYAEFSLNYSHLLSKITSLLLKPFFTTKALYKIKAFITFYSNKIRYFKRVLIEVQNFLLTKNKLLMQNCLKTKPFIIKRYTITPLHRYSATPSSFFLLR